MTSSLRAVADRAAARSAWLVCALFLLAGVAVLDDYGVGADAPTQRQTAQVVLDYVRGRNDELLRHKDRMYGMAVEVPLLGAERLLGLQDSRAIYRLRHLLTHLLFLAGGLSAAALAFRLYGRRSLALGALGLFLLHPRLYAHSFFNSKDLPFLSLFMLALLLTHWAFRRGTGPAFAWCGAGIGVLSNVRPMGLLLLAAVLALRLCDGLWAADRAARGRALRTGGLCAAACALTLYAAFPSLWGDPVRRLGEALAFAADHPHRELQLFRGRYVSPGALPPAYVPVWFAITAPPPALGFGLVGAAALARRAARRPGALLRNTRLRFEGLLLACCVLPALAVVLLEATAYNGWRHLYFLYAPFCLLATGGLHALAAAAQRGRGWPYGLAGAGAAATLGALVALHPHQHLYFNFLVDRATPARLLARYDLDYWRMTYRRAMEFLLAQYPDAPIRMPNRIWLGAAHRALLPAADRQRLKWVDHAGDFYITNRRSPKLGGPVQPAPYAPVLHAQQIYGNPIVEVLAVDLAQVDDATAAPYRAAYRALTARAPVIRDRFDVYLDAHAVSWVRAPCTAADTAHKFRLHVTPADLQDLPPDRRRAGFDIRDFFFFERGVRLDDACLVVVPRPAYPIRRLTVGQWLPGPSLTLWQADFTLPPARATAHDYRAAYRSLAARAPTHRGPFDLYVTASTVTFAKAPCTAADTVPKFLVHVTPADLQDLPPDRRRAGFDNLSGFFFERGVRLDGACLAVAPWPAYPVRHLTVGQFRPDWSVLWQADFARPPARATAHDYRAAYRSLAARAPTHRGPFDLYVTASTVTFAKAPCTAADAQPRFFLHAAPVNPQDLPGRPFHNLGFPFPARGARFDGRCLAAVPRPAAPVRQLTVGQWLPAAAGGSVLWQAELPLPRAPRALRAFRTAYRALAAAAPAHRGVFDVYVTAAAVAFAKQPCTAADTQPRFLLHFVPADTRDLPPARQSLGFANRDFAFAGPGAHFDDACLAWVPRPAYPIERLRVGQFRPGEEPLWRVEIPWAS